MGTTYTKSNPQLTFDNHESFCSFSYDTNLASIHDLNHDNLAHAVCGNGNICFIGLTDREQANTFLWTDGSQFDYGINITGSVEPWDVNEPGSDDCVVVTTDGKWQTTSCNSLHYGLCKYPKPVSIINDMTLPPSSQTLNIGQMDILDNLYIDFDLIIHEFNSGYIASEIVKISDNLYSNESYPFIWVNQVAQKFGIGSPLTHAINIGSIAETQLGSTLSIETPYNVQFTATQNRIEMIVNNVTIYNVSTVSHSILMDRNIYMGSPYVSVSNLNIAVSNAWDVDKYGEFNYLCDYNTRFTEKSGTWSITNPCGLQQTQSSDDYFSVWLGELDPSSINWVNYKIEASIRIAGDGGVAGILFRTQNVAGDFFTPENNYYYCFLVAWPNPEGCYLRCKKSINGVHTVLEEIQDSNIKKYTTYWLRIEVFNNNWEIYLDDVHRLSIANNSELAHGSIGLFTRQVSASTSPLIEFKSLRITFPTDGLNTLNPTSHPTIQPTIHPSFEPTIEPSNYPSFNPTKYPTSNPSSNPSYYPSSNPTIYPTTFTPTSPPQMSPTLSPFTEREDRYSTSLFIGDNASKEATGENKGTANLNWLLLIVGGALIIICFVLIFFIKRRRKKQHVKDKPGMVELNKVKSVEVEIEEVESPRTDEVDNDKDIYSNKNTLKYWLNNIGLVEYLDIFVNEGFGDNIDQMDAFSNLTDDQLQSIGIKKLAHRNLILVKVNKMKKGKNEQMEEGGHLLNTTENIIGDTAGGYMNDSSSSSGEMYHEQETIKNTTIDRDSDENDFNNEMYEKQVTKGNEQ